MFYWREQNFNNVSHEVISISVLTKIYSEHLFHSNPFYGGKKFTLIVRILGFLALPDLLLWMLALDVVYYEGYILNHSWCLFSLFIFGLSPYSKPQVFWILRLQIKNMHKIISCVIRTCSWFCKLVGIYFKRKLHNDCS